MYAAVKKHTPTMTDRELRGFIETFIFDRCKNGNQGFQRILLQMFGPMGQGKSSFINTCLMVWHNSPYINHAKAADTQGARTTERHAYRMTENITLVDNRGCTTLNDYETGEMFAQLANLLPLDKPVGWNKGFDLANRIVEAEPHVKSSDFIVPIFVYSVRKTMASEELQDLQEIIMTCRNMTGVLPIVALTHKKHGNVETVKDMFRSIGVNRFLSLENYTQTSPAYSKETHESVIQFLYDVVQDAQFRVNGKLVLDPEAEMMNRKVFVLNYLHNREVESHKRNLERQGVVEKAGMEQAMRLKMDEAEKERQKARQLHEEEMRRLEEEFERQRLRDQLAHEQQRNSLIPLKKKKNKRKDRKSSN